MRRLRRLCLDYIINYITMVYPVFWWLWAVFPSSSASLANPLIINELNYYYFCCVVLASLKIVRGMSYPYKLARLVESKTGRWYVVYHVWSIAENKLIRRRHYDYNNINDLKRRRILFLELAEKINKQLKRGAVFDAPQMNNFKSVSAAFKIVLDIKSKTLAKKTVEGYKSCSAAFLEFCRLHSRVGANINSIDSKFILSFRDHLLGFAVSARTINNKINYLSGMFSLMVDRGWVVANPCAKIKKLPERLTLKNRAFLDNERELIKPYLKKDLDLWLCCLLQYYCLIRPNECRQLKISDLYQDKKMILVSSAISKNRKNQFVRVPEQLHNFFLEHEIYSKPVNHFLIGGAGGLGRSTLYKRHKKILLELDLDKNLTFYSWKHTGFCALVRGGVAPHIIQKHGRWYSFQEMVNYAKSLGLFLEFESINYPDF